MEILINFNKKLIKNISVLIFLAKTLLQIHMKQEVFKYHTFLKTVLGYFQDNEQVSLKSKTGNSVNFSKI